MSDESVTQQLAAIFYADVSGYSRLTHADEIGTDHVIAGRAQNAQAVAQEILHIRPSFTIAGYLETQPYRERETLTSVAHALRAAGLPN